MKESLVLQIEEILEKHANAELAEGMSWYLRYQFSFLGIKKPERMALVKPLLKALAAKPDINVIEIAEYLWEKPYREFHYVAMEFLLLARKQWPEEIIDLFEWLITHHSWWDTVDFIASNLVGPYFQRWPAKRLEYVTRWSNSGQLWLIRTAILFQLKYKKHTDTALLFHIIRQHAGSPEFFIRKGIGWALRQYSLTAPEEVSAFVAATPLSPLSRREALRRIQ